ncbi:hypothetical protein C8F01DRAFT_1234958 [Mycena amicta]|nr:hypothetical protein C8F01DRAFT_1234958 [Mycena amicta]
MSQATGSGDTPASNTPETRPSVTPEMCPAAGTTPVSLKTKTTNGKEMMATDELQSNKGWADGAREALLERHILPYKRARGLGKREGEDYLVQVINEYTYVFPWDLPDHTEPETIRAWTPTTPPDDDSDLSEDDKQKKSAWIVMMMKRIRAWLVYRGDHPTKKRLAAMAAAGESVPAATGKVDLSDPFTILMYELAGLKPPSRAMPGLQQFMHEEYESILEPLVKKKWDALPAHEQVDKKGNPLKSAPWTMWTSADTQLDKDVFAEAMCEWPRTDPASRQHISAIDNIEPILKRIMTKVSEMTGLHIVVALSGPIPSLRGDIQIMDYAFGDNLAPTPMSFPEWDPEHFEEHFRDKMRSYLATTYRRSNLHVLKGNNNQIRIGSSSGSYSEKSPRPNKPYSEAMFNLWVTSRDHDILKCVLGAIRSSGPSQSRNDNTATCYQTHANLSGGFLNNHMGYLGQIGHHWNAGEPLYKMVVLYWRGKQH